MHKRKKYHELFAALFLTSILTLTVTPVLAKGSSQGSDVWWYKNVEPGMGTWKAIIYKTNNGVVHEWRYEWNGQPINVHLVYKPVEKFAKQPQGKNWVPWSFDDRYENLPGDEADLDDFLVRGSQYWVHFNKAEY